MTYTHPSHMNNTHRGDISMDMEEREFVAEIVRQAMLAGVKPNYVKDVLNRAFSAIPVTSFA